MMVIVDSVEFADRLHEPQPGRERAGPKVRGHSFTHHSPVLDTLACVELVRCQLWRRLPQVLGALGVRRRGIVGHTVVIPRCERAFQCPAAVTLSDKAGQVVEDHPSRSPSVAQVQAIDPRRRWISVGPGRS